MKANLLYYNGLIVELIIWQVLFVNWLKINIDCSIKGCPGLTSYAGIFKGSRGEYVNTFSVFLGVLWWVYRGHLYFGKCLEGKLSEVLVGKWFFFIMSYFLDQQVISWSLRGR